MALLGGFGDLNVDRSSKDGDKAAADKTGGTSTALTVRSADLLKLRVPELKKKLVEAGVDLKKYPGTVEKKVRRGVLCALRSVAYGVPNPLVSWCVEVEVKVEVTCGRGGGTLCFGAVIVATGADTSREARISIVDFR